MKEGAREILGKTISAMVVKHSGEFPRSQIFLVFEDGTHFEFYSGAEIHQTGGVDKGGLEHVRKYMAGKCHVVFETFPKFLT